MNKNDINILSINWESMKEKSERCQYKFDFDISSGCYVEFGMVGINVCKYKQNKWFCKSINYWKELSFDEFLNKFKETEWEVI